MKPVTSVLVVISVGCGRAGFDALDDGGAAPGDTTDAPVCGAPVGHDDDGDGVDDACDVCPGTAGTQADADGDSVGDACDPNAAQAIDTLLVFDPFVTMLPMWTPNPGVTIGNDEMVMLGRGGTVTAVLDSPPARETFRIAGTVNDVDPDPHQVALLLGPDAPPSGYYCELYEDPPTGMFWLSMTYTLDGIVFDSGSKSLIPGPFASGAFELALEHDPPNITCDAVWSGQRYQVVAAIPAGIALERAAVGATRANATLTSFSRILTQ